jgi:hypothetical protein
MDVAGDLEGQGCRGDDVGCYWEDFWGNNDRINLWRDQNHTLVGIQLGIPHRPYLLFFFEAW